MSQKRSLRRKSKLTTAKDESTSQNEISTDKSKVARDIDVNAELKSLGWMVGLLSLTVVVYASLFALLKDPRDQGFGWMSILVSFSYFKIFREKIIDKTRPVATYGLEMLRLLIISLVLFFLLRMAFPQSLDPNNFTVPFFILAIVSILASMFLKKRQSKKNTATVKPSKRTRERKNKNR